MSPQEPPPAPPGPADPTPGRAPLWLVCEDGREYTDRFTRYLGLRFRYERVVDAAALCARAAAGDAAGVILDLDFRRTPVDRLVDEDGRPPAANDPGARARLTSSQGLFILRALRRAGSDLRVLLFADLDDADQVAYLASHYGPLEVVPSHESLGDTAERMRRG